MEGTETKVSESELDTVGLTVQARLDLQNTTFWSGVGVAWGPSVDTLPALAARIMQYIPKFRISSTLGDKTLTDFLRAGLPKAVEYVKQTSILFPADGKADNQPVMLDALPSFTVAQEKYFVTQSTQLSANQVVCVLANILLCTLPELPQAWSYPSLSGMDLWALPSRFALSQLTDYFVSLNTVSECPLEVQRVRMASDCVDQLLKVRGDRVLSEVIFVADGQGAAARVVFADMFLGGGVLGKGAGQEEALFREHPSALAAMLVCMKMEAGEAVVVRGHRRLTGTTTSRPGPEFLCVDAWAFAWVGGDQFSEQFLRSELSKALAGVVCAKSPVISTAGWGCGTFGGDFVLKLCLQWIACELSGKTMQWETEFCSEFTSKGRRLVSGLTSKKNTVGTLWQTLVAYGSGKRSVPLIEFLSP